MIPRISLRKPKWSLRQLFIVVLVVVLVETLVMDWVSLRQVRVTDQSGLSVVHSFRVISALDEFALRFEEAVARRDESKALGSERLEALNRSFFRLEHMNEFDERERADIAALHEFLFAGNGTAIDETKMFASVDKISSRLRSLRDDEGRVLNERLQWDSRENLRASKQVRWTSAIDVLLIGFLGLVYLYDVKNRRRTEEALRDTLDDLHRANVHLDRLNLSKNEILQHAAHDLRNPLGSIRGLADLIEMEIENKTSVTEMSSRIRQITNRTLKLVDSIVQSATVDDPPTEQHQVLRLERCLEEACNHLQPQAVRKRQSIELAVSAPVSVRGDWSRLEDAFTNLVGNGLKFSPPGSKVFVRCALQQNVARIEIEDQGPGISHEDRAKAFRSRQRLSAQPTGDETSTGLGLFIVKQTIESHGGRVSISDPRPDKGATFVVELPLDS